jgi:hypothetical protein
MECMTTSVPESRRYRFGLRQLLVFILGVGLFLGAVRGIGLNPLLILVCPAIAMVCSLLLRPKNGWGNVAVEVMLAGVVLALLLLLYAVIGIGEMLG